MSKEGSELPMRETVTNAAVVCFKSASWALC